MLYVCWYMILLQISYYIYLLTVVCCDGKELSLYCWWSSTNWLCSPYPDVRQQSYIMKHNINWSFVNRSTSISRFSNVFWSDRLLNFWLSGLSYAWTGMLCFDILIFSMTMYKSVVYRHESSNILHTMFRDGKSLKALPRRDGKLIFLMCIGVIYFGYVAASWRRYFDSKRYCSRAMLLACSSVLISYHVSVCTSPVCISSSQSFTQFPVVSDQL